MLYRFRMRNREGEGEKYRSDGMYVRGTGTCLPFCGHVDDPRIDEQSADKFYRYVPFRPRVVLAFSPPPGHFFAVPRTFVDV